MQSFTDDYGATYTIHETTFPNPVTGASTVLFVLVNESGAILRASTATWDAKAWVRDFALQSV